MTTIIRYVLIAALRDRLFLAMLVATLAATGISSVLAATSMIEVEQMTLTFSGACARLILVLGLIVFVSFHVRQAFDNREIDVLLSRPVSRPMLVFAYWAAFSIAATVMAALAVGVVAALSPMHLHGFAGWGVSLLLEAWLVVAFTLFAALILRSGVMTVLTSVGFYALSRMMGYFLATISARGLFSVAEYNEAAQTLTNALAVVVPRLDFFAKTRWLIYGFESSASEIRVFVVQALVFIPLLLVATVVDFRRRQF
jgi:hypothetical protein